MSLLSGDIVVAEDSDVEECLSSSAQPARETSANAASSLSDFECKSLIANDETF